MFKLRTCCEFGESRLGKRRNQGREGELFADYSVVTVAAVLVGLPCLAVFLVAPRHLTRGLTLGATSG